MQLTQEILKDLLLYNPTTGTMTWKPRDMTWFNTERAWKSWNTKNAGNDILCEGKREDITYIVCRLLGKGYRVHRLAWLYTTGVWPEQVDHIDGDGTNNKLNNLREVTNTINSRNTSRMSTNTSGITGVSWDKARSKWHASIKVAGKSKSLGRHKDFFEACCARKSANNLYGFHENHGRC